METKNRNYPLPNGASLSEDLPRIQEAFRKIDEDVDGIYMDFQKKLHIQTVRLGNLILFNLSRTQKIKIGVVA